MILNAFMPLIELCMLGMAAYARHAFDQGRCCWKGTPAVTKTTKQKTLFGYRNLYIGWHFNIHNKYAYILSTTWVTFLFGPGLPVLFPICLLSKLMLYTCNRIELAYFSRRPPVYDGKMNKTVIDLLFVSPLLYILYGAWLYSNQ